MFTVIDGHIQVIHRLKRLGVILAQHDVNNQIDVGHVNTAIACDIGRCISLGLAQHDIDDLINIGHINHTVASGVALDSRTCCCKHSHQNGESQKKSS